MTVVRIHSIFPSTESLCALWGTTLEPSWVMMTNEMLTKLTVNESSLSAALITLVVEMRVLLVLVVQVVLCLIYDWNYL